MLEHDTRLSLAELSAAGIRLRPVDAVTIVRALIDQVIRGEIPGVPSAHVIRLSPAGALTIEGPVAAGARAVSRAAQLLDTLLPGFDAPSEYRVPGALRLIVARALGTLDVEPHSTLEILSEALQRFGAADSTVALRELASSYRDAAVPKTAAATSAAGTAADHAPLPQNPPSAVASADTDLAELAPLSALTISDIRRARRATGLSLTEVSTRTRIPVAMLRQLEWGYLRNWPLGPSGKTQLVRYARAAGLDEHMVVAVAAPLMEEAGRPAHELLEPEVIEIQLADELPGPRELGELPAIAVRPRRRRVGRMLAALAIPAALAIALTPGVRDELQRRLAVPSLPSGPAIDVPQPAAHAAPPSTIPERDAVRPEPAAGVPDARPAAVSSEPPAAARSELSAYADTLASVGGASFQDAGAGGEVVPTGTSGGAVLRLTRIVNDSARNFHIRLSPDGRRIAFDSDRDGERGVYLADHDGTNVRRVSGEGFAAVPSWAPDSRALVYARSETDRPGVWNLWILDLDTAAERRITAHSGGQPWGASWFADGRRIAYSLGDRLLIHDVEAGRARAFDAPRGGTIVRTPAVSPDGRRVLFQVDRDGAWLLDLADGGMRKVLSDPTAEDYLWSPDGRRVAYYSRQSGEWGVWVLTK